mmetsp:Transcript_26425/g.43456  ORF Transcript_26425/g.43456 Transcript_26425/m.43456 type:complete len:151 (+) Transcript_26425:255-707(+)
MKFLPTIVLFSAISVFVGDCFHVDPTPERIRNTYLERFQDLNKIRHEGDTTVKEYTNEERQWRFPDASLVRRPGSDSLPIMTDQDRTWRFPQRTAVRKSSNVQAYLDKDRMWRQPRDELTRHRDGLPDRLHDEDRLWWKTDNFDHLLLED